MISHATSQPARFLGYEICSAHADSKRDQRGRRSVNGHIMLRVPWDVITALCSRYERRGKPDARPLPDQPTRAGRGGDGPHSIAEL
jgi:hypothetical protein